MSQKGIYDKNRILYNFEQPESVKVVPTDLLQIPFDNKTYNEGDTAHLTITSGKYFVDPTKSYINIEVQITGDGVNPIQANFGRGSASNLFGGIRIFHKSGTQISNVIDFDLWKKAKDYVEKNEFWFDSTGFIAGYRPDLTDYIWTEVGPQTRSFKIKLCDLHPFFKGRDSKLFAPDIIDNLRLELDLNRAGRAFFTSVASSAITDWKIVNIDLQTALVDVMDEAADVVNDIANKNGLKWTYNDVFISTRQIQGSTNNINTSVDKSVSLAQNVITFIRDATGDTNTGFDSHTYPKVSSGVKWNYRIANILYPFKRQVTNEFDSYTSLIDAFEWECGTNLPYSAYDEHNLLYPTLLRTEDHLLNSGDYLNANKRLELELEKNTIQANQLVHTCLEYTKLLTVNGVNSKVDE
jgi:hypothetical protein